MMLLLLLVLAVIWRLLALSHALPTFLEPNHLPSPPSLAPLTLNERDATGITPTVANVSHTSFAAPNPNVPTLEEIVSSGIAIFAPHVRSLSVWRVFVTPSSAREAGQAADFKRVRLECQIKYPGSGVSKILVADNDPAKPLEWTPPHVSIDITRYTPWRPYHWTPDQSSLVTAFQILEHKGLGSEEWAKVVQLSYFDDQLEPGTHGPSGGNQVYFAFAKPMRLPPMPGPVGFLWTLVGMTSGLVHRDLLFDPQAGPDTDFGEMMESSSNGTRVVARSLASVESGTNGDER